MPIMSDRMMAQVRRILTNILQPKADTPPVHATRSVTYTNDLGTQTYAFPAKPSHKVRALSGFW